MQTTKQRWFGLRSARADDNHTNGKGAWASAREGVSSAREGWSNVATEAADRVREAAQKVPEVLPEVHVPDVRLRDVHLPDIHLPQLRRRKPWYARVWPYAATLTVGAASAAALTYFFDPQRGKARRAQTIDQLAGTVRKGVKTAGRVGRKVSSDAGGWRQRMAAASERKEPGQFDDATLAHKVKSELFRDPEIPKGDININAENGVVVLRGMVHSPEQVKKIVDQVRAIDGVRDVQNLLHMSMPAERTVAERSGTETPTETTPAPA